MAVTFSTFDTTPAGAVAAIKAAILASSDWSNPAGDRVQCTTTRGADMVVDLADAAANAIRLQFAAYRTTALADKAIRYLYWRGSGGATTDTLHCTVAAGKNHLLIQVEGPRNGEVNAADAVYGSHRPFFFLCDLVPYLSGDTVPVVVLGGTSTATTPTGSTSYPIYVSRNAANNSSWVPGVLTTLSPQSAESAGSIYRYNPQLLITSTGEYVALPYVVFEDVAGIRGRLSKIYYRGNSAPGSLTPDPPATVFQRTTIGGETYINITAMKYSGSGASMSPFRQTTNGQQDSAVIAVPYS